MLLAEPLSKFLRFENIGIKKLQNQMTLEVVNFGEISGSTVEHLIVILTFLKAK